jgi:hypothetical protein
MRGSNRARRAFIALLSGASIMAVGLSGCQPAQPVEQTAKVCNPKTDATCKPTPNTKVIVR